MADRNNKERILKTLLESPKTTGNISIALGYGDRGYNAIGDDLKDMEKEGFIRSEKKKMPGVRGAVPTCHDIVYEHSVLEKILNKYLKSSHYSHLLSAMQNNDTILESLVAKHFWLISFIEMYSEYYKYFDEIYKDPDECTISWRYPQLPADDDRFTINDACYECCGAITQRRCFEDRRELKSSIDNKQQLLKTAFKERLVLSPSFFNFSLNNSPEKFKQKYDNIYSMTNEAKRNFQLTDEERESVREIIDNRIFEPLIKHFNKIFEICVHHDGSNEKAKEEAIAKVVALNRYSEEKSEFQEILMNEAIKRSAKAQSQGK